MSDGGADFAGCLIHKHDLWGGKVFSVMEDVFELQIAKTTHRVIKYLRGRWVAARRIIKGLDENVQHLSQPQQPSQQRWALRCDWLTISRGYYHTYRE